MIISSPKLFEVLLREFQTTFEYPFYSNIDDADRKQIALRKRLIDEERQEYYNAQSDLARLDAVCDSLYVIIGGAVQFGIGIDAYTSGQLRDSNRIRFHDINNVVSPLVDEYASIFPCPRRTHEWTNKSIQRLLDIGNLYGWKLRDAFVQVHMNNMSKLWDTPPSDKKGFVIKRKGSKWLVKDTGGKVVKAPDFVPVELKAYL